MVIVFNIALLALPVAASSSAHRNGPGKRLTFSEDGAFQIAIIEDLHYGEAEESFGPIQDALTTRTVASLLDEEPETDLVVINGDLISREVTLTNSTAYIDQVVSPMLDRNLTWASLYGNHDPGFNRSAEDMLAREQQWPNARTRSMVPEPQRLGVTNYYLPVYAAGCGLSCGCVPELLLWFFDSRGGFEYQKQDADGERVPQTNWVEPEVVEWFETENERLATKYNKAIPSLTFVHIPPQVLLPLREDAGIDPERQPGIDNMDITGQAWGFCANGTRSSDCEHGMQDAPFMRAIASTPGILGLFSAHLHGNSWCQRWGSKTLPDYDILPEGDGLFICFGQRTGFGGNGNWERGSRQILLRQDNLAQGEFDSWIRLESGEVVGVITLNSTYGEDIYPVSPDRQTFCDVCK